MVGFSFRTPNRIEPFFTTKEIGKGSGLGLSQALGFAKQSGGGMRIETRTGEVTDDTIQSADITTLVNWVGSQPPWSDFPFVLLTEPGGGLERNPTASRQMEALGNVAFLERPFHPTTLISVVKTAIRARRRQYEARSRLEALRESEGQARHAEIELRALNERGSSCRADS